jgi:hypothetical protein
MNQQDPHQLSPEAIAEFKRLYQSEFGEALTDDEAEAMTLRLLRIFDLLTRPVSAEAHNTLPVIHC